jgi:hypothetical protein
MDRDIHLLGLVLYTGTNCTAQNVPGFFAGSDLIRVLANENNVWVQHLINIITNKIR